MTTRRHLYDVRSYRDEASPLRSLPLQPASLQALDPRGHYALSARRHPPEAVRRRWFRRLGRDRPVPAGLDPYRAIAEDVLETPLNLQVPSVDVRETAYASRT